MPLTPGAHVGRYEILSPIGAGGMGEVYRARDPQLGRDVALKVIGGDEPPDAGRLRRFETEARAVAALRHPHILDVHDVGTCDGRPYVVFELLEGESLKQRLARGPLPVRKAVEIAGQVCGALAAAHARGIVHRDLKPENLFLAAEGVRVLDFGLAKLVGPAESDASEGPTEGATDPVVWVGTPGYVSPEQVCGAPVSARSDIFAFGAVLYEMLTGRRAFAGATRVETLSAVLEADPPAMTREGGAAVPPPVERIVRRCLEKEPDDRFQSARDVAFAFEALSVSGAEDATPSPKPRRHGRRWLAAAAALVGVAAAFSAGALVERARPARPAPTFRPLTFRRGWMQQARFAPDGRTVIYAAAWEGRPLSLYETRTDSAESRSLGISHADVLAVSPQGTMAFVSNSGRSGYIQIGSLAIAPIPGVAGVAPREVLGNVIAAQWTPDGRLFVGVWNGEETTLELPPGNVVLRAPGWAAFARLSPDARYVAFISGRTTSLVLLDLRRRSTRTLVERLASFSSLAWAPSGREVWYAEGTDGDAKDIWAVDLSGRRRLVYRSPLALSVVDIAPDGRALLRRSLCRDWVLLFGPGEAVQDVTIGNGTELAALSTDGRDVLLRESGRTFLRRVDGEPVLVGEGAGQDLSPDGGAVLAIRDGRLEWEPTNAGLPRTVDAGIATPNAALFLPPDGKRALVSGVEPDGGLASYRVVSIEPGPPATGRRNLTLPWRRPTPLAVSPDGRLVAGVWKRGMLTVLPIDGGPARDVGVVPPAFAPRRWSEDGRSIFLADPNENPGCTLARFDLASSRFAPLRNVAPPDATGVNNCNALIPSGDGSSCAAAYNRCFSDLVLAEGLR